MCRVMCHVLVIELYVFYGFMSGQLWVYVVIGWSAVGAGGAIAPFGVRRVTETLHRVVSRSSPGTSRTLLSKAHRTMFHRVFVFRCPSFLRGLCRSVPRISGSRRLVYVLMTLKRSMGRVTRLVCFSPRQMRLLYTSIYHGLGIARIQRVRVLVGGLLSWGCMP